MLRLVLYLFVFAPLVSAKPTRTSPDENEIASPAKVKRETPHLCRRTFPQGSTTTAGRPAGRNSSLALYLKKLYRTHDASFFKTNRFVGFEKEDESKLLIGTFDTCNMAILKFKLKQPPFRVQDILSAEFRIYRKPTLGITGNSKNELFFSWLFKFIPNSPTKGALLVRADPKGSTKGRWLSIQVTSTLREWLTNSSTNNGFLLKTTNPAGKVLNPFKLGYAGFEATEDKRPFIVVQYRYPAKNDEEKDDKNDEEGTTDPSEPDTDIPPKMMKKKTTKMTKKARQTHQNQGEDDEKEENEENEDDKIA